MKRLASTALAALLVAGCVSTPERSTPQTVPLPETWTAGADRGEIDDHWWTSFEDPGLESLIGRALEYNRDLRATAARLEQAAARARIAGADLRPSLSAGLDASRRRQVFVGFPIPGDEVPSTTSTSLGLSLSASWEVDLWGRLRAGARAALADFEAAHADYAAARLSLAALTAKAWFGVVEARQQLELAEASAESFRRSAEQVRSRYESGVRPPVDLRLALTRLAEAEALVELRRGRLDAETRGLEVLVGDYPAGAIRSERELPPPPGPLRAGLPADLVARRPDLIAAERRLAAADQRLLEARRSLYPRLSLTASGGTVSDDLRDLLDGDFRVWTLVGNLVAPLFQGGRLRANVDLSAAGRDLALATYAQSVLDAFAEVETALAAEQTLAARESALAEAARQSGAAEALALDRYRSGLDDYIAVLQAQASTLSARSQWLAVRRARLENRIDLHVALGGGFEPTRSSLANEDGA